MFMGIIGEYVGRIFLGMSRNPQFVVRSVHQMEAQERGSAHAQQEGKICAAAVKEDAPCSADKAEQNAQAGEKD